MSLKETFIVVREGGERIWRGKCPSDPAIIAQTIAKRVPSAQRVVFETGPLSVWFYHALTEKGVPAICIDARHAKAALDMAPNKTDQNDADGLAQIAEVGFYRKVRVKSFDSMLVRTLIAVRDQMIKMTTKMSNQIRGLMKTFGLVVPKSSGKVSEGHVRELLASNPGLEAIILSLLEAWRVMRARVAELSKQLIASARATGRCLDRPDHQALPVGRGRL